MKRVITAVVGIAFALWTVFALPPGGFFALLCLLFTLIAWEYIRVQRHWAPGAPLWLVFLFVPLTALALTPRLTAWTPFGGAAFVAGLISLGAGVAVLAGRTPVREAAPGMGALAFGAVYLGLPLAALAELQFRDPWLLVLLLAIVWIGDSAAFYVGTRWGRHRLAPVVSPKKTWEGAAAAAVASAAVVAAWSLRQGGSVDLPLIGLAVSTSVMAQVGDLVESSLKRGAGVKDSGRLLPGHGGFLDRFDALLFAAPTWWWLLGVSGRLPAGV